jgi:hypothetical protein
MSYNSLGQNMLPVEVILSHHNRKQISLAQLRKISARHWLDFAICAAQSTAQTATNCSDRFAQLGTIGRIRRDQVFKSLTLVVLLPTLMACLPLPHFQHDAPQIDGTIRRNGNLARQVKVSYIINQSFGTHCSGADQETQTDANGRFRTQVVGEWMPFFLYGDRKDHWSLCFQFPDGAEVVWSDDGYWGGPRQQRLICNFGKELVVSAKPLQLDAYRYGQNSSCKLAETEAQ